MNISGSRFLVIGATGVLGGQVAADLVVAGADVHVITRSDKPLRPELQQLPRAFADLVDRDSLTAAMTALGGNFDGIINAAGVVAFGSIDEVPATVVAELFAVNATGVINALATARHHLRENGVFGSFTGVAADMVLMGMSAYCASKTAAKMAMAIAAREWRSGKLRILDIRAPHTETGLIERALWGQAPRMGAGLEPSAVSARVLHALSTDEKDLPAESFSSDSQ